MKKCIALILVLVLSAALISISVGAEGTYLKGDSDGDGVVTILDATKIQRLLVELEEDSDGMIALRGNVVGDDLDILDATHIQRYLADFDNIYEIGTELPIPGPTNPPTEAPTKDPDELPFVPAR